jgi:hypothetical protein
MQTSQSNFFRPLIFAFMQSPAFKLGISKSQIIIIGLFLLRLPL